MMTQQRLRRLEALVQRWRHSRGQTPPVPRPVQTAQDLVDLLQEQVQAVRAETGASALERARVLGLLVEIARKVLEARDTAARLEMLETVLKQRRRQPRPQA